MPEHNLEHLVGFPIEARHLFTRLLDQELQPATVLMRLVERHLADLEAIGQRDELLNLVRARELTALARRLLAHYPEAPETDRRLIQAAVLYFVLDNDAAPDSRSLLGLEDDARVLAAVARHLEERPQQAPD